MEVLDHGSVLSIWSTADNHTILCVNYSLDYNNKFQHMILGLTIYHMTLGRGFKIQWHPFPV